MRERVRAHDWAATGLGAMESWPAALKVTVSLCLNSRFPMFVWWGPELINIYNDAYVPMLGKRHPAALGRPARESWAEIWDVVGPQADAVMSRGESTWNERVLLVMERHGFTEETWFTWSYSPIFAVDGSGRVEGLYCAVTEETQRVLAERERDRLFAQKQIALDAAEMGWWHYDPVEKVTRFDARFGQIFGVAGDCSAGEVLASRVHPEDLAALGVKVEAALDPANPKPYAARFRVVREDGSVRWVDVHGLASFAGEGSDRRAASLVGTIVDVTEPREMEQLLRTSEERLALAVGSAELGTFYCPMPQGEILWNQKCKEHFWLPPDAKIDFDLFYSRLHPEDRERTRAAVERTIFHKAPYDVEYRTVSPDGRVRWVRAKGRAFHDGAGNPVRFDGITLDVTDQKRAEEDREQFLNAERAARSEAERASRMKDEFLATLSHELRTPLNAILGWSQVLRSGTADADDISQGLETIERNARAQTKIIGDLLEMSRILSGKMRLEIEPLDLAAVVRSAVETVRHAAEVKGVGLTVSLDGAGIGRVSGDAARLQQVFWNLLSNSVKHCARGGQIRVGLSRADSGATVEVSVADDGEGISGEFLPYVFDRFRQADSSTTRRHSGLGLGLSIVKQLVELHGGHVRAESAGSGRGATFTVSLPVVQPKRQTNRDIPLEVGLGASAVAAVGLPPLPRDIDIKLAGVHALVVDDELDVRELVRRVLEGFEAKVTTASSAAEAFGLLRDVRPHVLVSDIGMPGEDGYSLIQRVRAMPSAEGGEVPAIALTAYARSEDRARAMIAGFSGHLTKPVDPVELVALVASAVRGR